MPVVLAALLGGLVSLVGTIVGRVLIALGIGFVAFSGMEAGLSALQTQAFSYITALPPTIVGMLGMMKLGTAINIIVAAYTARLALMGLNSGVVRKMAFGVGDIRRAGG